MNQHEITFELRSGLDDLLWGPSSPHAVSTGGYLTPGVERPGREANHLPPASSRMSGIILLFLQYVFMA
jgi:hypothetical protein